MALGYQDTLVASKVGGSSFGTFTTAKTVLNSPDVITLPPSFFVIGKKLRIGIRGGIGSLVTTPGTITFQVMLNAVIAFTTGAIQLNATAHTNLPFWLDIDLICRAVGSGTSANLIGLGRIVGAMVTPTAAQVDGVNSNAVIVVPATAMAVGTGFDSTISQVLDLFAGFSISNAANTIKIEDYTVQSLN